jgi:hypothetical protein
MNESGICRVIQGLQEEHDSVYRFTDGIAGNAYRIYVMITGSDEMESLHFRNFREVTKKYGVLQPEKPRSLLTIMTNRKSKKFNLSPNIVGNKEQPDITVKKWAKVYPED